MSRREELEKAFEDGRWDMFHLMTSVLYGKECYFRQDNGVIYSRASGKYLKDFEEAYREWQSDVEF